ncbi:hypothetical protein NliqN6_5753 [Naganishia liquefaciens]|uniref:Uncharacterized protein n=1 Tax=Naganishia liquefaciens TaxID=104408 RepID=A0A8H3YJA7_9TREE|nr:hypothetical protein NliqN6_5753 [Naganishia liquefaciens]
MQPGRIIVELSEHVCILKLFRRVGALEADGPGHDLNDAPERSEQDEIVAGHDDLAATGFFRILQASEDLDDTLVPVGNPYVQASQVLSDTTVLVKFRHLKPYMSLFACRGDSEGDLVGEPAVGLAKGIAVWAWHSQSVPNIHNRDVALRIAVDLYPILRIHN